MSDHVIDFSFSWYRISWYRMFAVLCHFSELEAFCNVEKTAYTSRRMKMDGDASTQLLPCPVLKSRSEASHIAFDPDADLAAHVILRHDKSVLIAAANIPVYNFG